MLGAPATSKVQEEAEVPAQLVMGVRTVRYYLHLHHLNLLFTIPMEMQGKMQIAIMDKILAELVAAAALEWMGWLMQSLILQAQHLSLMRMGGEVGRG